MAIYGVDGCRAGWFYVSERDDRFNFGIVETLVDLVASASVASVMFIDIPMGLRDTSAVPCACDVAARKLLGRPRSSSVFAVPPRAVLGCDDYASALAKSRHLSGKGLSRQAFGIVRKIREVDELLANAVRPSLNLREIHPELCFWALADGHAMTYSKETEAGFRERLAVLERKLPSAPQLVSDAMAKYLRRDLARDDIVDALAALVTAMQPRDRLSTVPLDPERYARGLIMENVYCSLSARAD